MKKGTEIPINNLIHDQNIHSKYVKTKKIQILLKNACRSTIIVKKLNILEKNMIMTYQHNLNFHFAGNFTFH